MMDRREDWPVSSGLSRQHRGPDHDLPMITETLQPITCFITTKSEILHDDAACRAPAPRTSLRTALTVTTQHLSQRHRA